MKKLMIISLALVSMFTSANAQLLYKISGKDLKSPSYIVGTYHLAPVSFVNAIEGIPDALTNTEQVCGELDMEDMKKPESVQKMAVAMLLPHGKTLKSILTEEEYTRLNKLLKDLTSADMSNPIVEAKFGNITPQALNTQLTLLMSLKHARGFDPTQSFDDYFQKFAKRNHEPVIGFETVDKQIEVLFKSIPLEHQKQLGIRWRKMRRETLMPQASVAVMNSCSRRERIWPRTRRAIPGQPRKPKISIK